MSMWQTRVEGLPTELSVIYRSEAGGWQYNHHQGIVWFEGRFFASWSSAQVYEDTSNQLVRFATSTDGRTWSPDAHLAPDHDGPDGPRFQSASGFWQRDGILYGLAGYSVGLYTREEDIDRGHKHVLWEAYRWTGRDWEPAGTLQKDFWPNYGDGVGRLRSGRYLVAGHDLKMNPVVLVGGQGGLDDWHRVALNLPADGRLLIEPSWWEADDGIIHMLIRSHSYQLYYATSSDGGHSWTTPVPSGIPDAIAKVAVGKLSDGRVYLAGNSRPPQPAPGWPEQNVGGAGPGLGGHPGFLPRDPLTLSIAEDGRHFSRTWTLRTGLIPYRYPSSVRNNGFGYGLGYQYPSAIEHDGRLYIIHCVNKEDIAVVSVALGDVRG